MKMLIPSLVDMINWETFLGISFGSSVLAFDKNMKTCFSNDLQKKNFLIFLKIIDLLINLIPKKVAL